MDFWQSMYADRSKRMKASDIRDAFKLAERADIISFAGGFPSPETFPLTAVAQIARDVVLNQGALSLQYGPTEGIYELRALIAERMRSQGVACTPEEVLITNGSQQALDLIAKIILNPHDGVIVEQPAYIGGLSAIGHYEADFLGVPLDDDGLCVDELHVRLTARASYNNGKSGKNGSVGHGVTPPKLCYTVPNFQNPSGVTLSDERRRALVDLAERFGFGVIEDNPYGELRFDGVSKPHIKSFDAAGRVLYLGSFSKVFLPGFRLGYVVGPEPLIQKLAIGKQGTDLCSNSFGQRLILECARRGLLESHLRAIVDVYRKKRDLMLEALGEHFPAEVYWTYPEGGFFVWVTLPGTMDAKELLARAVSEERVAYVGGGAFFTDNSGKNTIRLAYSQASDDRIVEGVRRLGRFLKEEVQKGGARMMRTAGVLSNRL